MVRISQVAEGQGFDDPASFSRKFKRQFGIAPSAVLGAGLREAAQAGTSKPDSFSDYRNWFKSVAGNDRDRME